MLVIFIRSIILYIAVLISLRVMGKGEIAEMNCNIRNTKILYI